jgi:hypothetical protein
MVNDEIEKKSITKKKPKKPMLTEFTRKTHDSVHETVIVS